MHRIAVCYGQPEDPESFEHHYREIHVPLARAVPGVRRITYGRCEPMGGKPAPHFFVAALYFDTAEAASVGLSSPEMHTTADDVANFATGGVVMYRQSEDEISLPS
ncbi:hypothetical protein AXA44_21880 [Rhodococcus sp. SC4]|nr:hypothetical protein AXA44_21880 [Rhodococcus sp. SC4]